MRGAARSPVCSRCWRTTTGATICTGWPLRCRLRSTICCRWWMLPCCWGSPGWKKATSKSLRRAARLPRPTSCGVKSCSAPPRSKTSRSSARLPGRSKPAPTTRCRMASSKICSMSTSARRKPRRSLKRPSDGAATRSCSITTQTPTGSSFRKRRPRPLGLRRFRVDAPARTFSHRDRGAHLVRAAGPGGLRRGAGGNRGPAGDRAILVRRHDAGGRDLPLTPRVAALCVLFRRAYFIGLRAEPAVRAGIRLHRGVQQTHRRPDGGRARHPAIHSGAELPAGRDAGHGSAIPDAATRRGIRRDPADLHGPSLEHGVQLSLLFALGYGYIAAYNKRIEGLMVAVHDILQSIPVLSFLPGVMLAMVALFPTRQLGVEFGAILLIFTGQVWNMAFSFYASLKSIPRELREAARIYGFGKWQRFVELELPYGAIGLVWNSMVSVAGGWFFLMACEMFMLGKRDFRLPGLGSYLQTAASAGDTSAIFWGLGTMIGVILLIHQLVWRPAIAWSDKFKFEQVESGAQPSSAVLRSEEHT